MTYPRTRLPRTVSIILMPVFLTATLSAASAQDSPDTILAQTATVTLTRGDYEAELQRLPPEMRDEFASDPKRLSALLNNMLLGKALAADARKAGIDRDPLVQRRLALESDKLLALLQTKRIEKDARAEFDARSHNFELKARERYAVQKDRLRVPAKVKVSQIAFATGKHPPDAALALAQDVRAKLLGGADFASVAQKVSDDPSAASTRGDLGWVRPAQLDSALARAVSALKTPGEITEPIQTAYGYHLLRLDGIQPERQQTFDEAKGQLMAELRSEFVNEQRDLRLDTIRKDPSLKVNQAAVDALVVQVPGPEAYGRGGAPAPR